MFDEILKKGGSKFDFWVECFWDEVMNEVLMKVNLLSSILLTMITH